MNNEELFERLNSKMNIIIVILLFICLIITNKYNEIEMSKKLDKIIQNQEKKVEK